MLRVQNLHEAIYAKLLTGSLENSIHLPVLPPVIKSQKQWIRQPV